MKQLENDAKRFWAKVEKGPSCWIWKAGIRAGYGQFWFNGADHGAHRVSVLLSGREIPDGKVVRHSCDERRCVNPDHLLVGTQRDNVMDMYARGRGCHHQISPKRRSEMARNAAKVRWAKFKAEAA